MLGSPCPILKQIWVLVRERLRDCYWQLQPAPIRPAKRPLATITLDSRWLGNVRMDVTNQ
jgi:hypothetical protein